MSDEEELAILVILESPMVLQLTPELRNFVRRYELYVERYQRKMDQPGGCSPCVERRHLADLTQLAKQVHTFLQTNPEVAKFVPQLKQTAEMKWQNQQS